MKTRVRVRLVCEEEVEIDVEHEPDDDPCDLTEEDKKRAFREASSFADWDVDDVDKVAP
jgi:hypothetical protein